MPRSHINIVTLKQVIQKTGWYAWMGVHLTCREGVFFCCGTYWIWRQRRMRSSGLLSSNAKLGIVGVHVLSVGRLNHAFVEPREVFQAALMNNADSITAFHNHPSGDPKPSVEDIFMTRKIKAAGKMPGLS